MSNNPSSPLTVKLLCQDDSGTARLDPIVAQLGLTRPRRSLAHPDRGAARLNPTVVQLGSTAARLGAGLLFTISQMASGAFTGRSNRNMRSGVGCTSRAIEAVTPSDCLYQPHAVLHE